MFWRAKNWGKWFPRCGVIALLFALILATIASAAHQVEYEMNADGFAYDVAAHSVADTDSPTFDGTLADRACASSFLCHAPLTLIFDTVETLGLHSLSDNNLPDPGVFLRSQVIEVATPPPLTPAPDARG